MLDPTMREHNGLGCVATERIKQNAKWGEQNHDSLKWFAILAEEFGEVANAINEEFPTIKSQYSQEAIEDNLEYELIQVAAVAVAWVECIRRRGRDAES